MKVVITGANGFIGQAMVAFLQEQAPNVGLYGVLRKDSASKSDPPIRTGTRAEIADVLIHLAGQGGIPESIKDPLGTFEVACRGTIDCIDTARSLGIGTVVIASTCALYPRGPEAAQENSPVALETPYALAKHTAEEYGLAAAKLARQDVRFVRLANAYGPGQRRHLVYDVARRAMRGDEPITLLSSGSERRDFIHVSDVARALWTVATRGNPGTIYNAGSGDPRRVLDVARMIGDEFGVSVITPLGSAEDNFGAADAFPNVGRLRKLAFEPKFTIEIGLKDTLKWIRENS